MNKYLLLTAAVAVVLTSCSGTEESNMENNTSQVTDVKVPVSLTSALATTRSSGTLQATQIAKDVKVGVSIFKTSTTATTDGYGTINKQYTADGNGALTPSAVDYYATDANVDIYAYAPLQSTATAVSFSVQADQTSTAVDAGYLASDLIYATPLTKVASSSSAKALTFTHKLSRIIVTLKAGTGINANTFTTATINILNTKPTTTFTPSTGAIADATGTAATITASTGSDTGYAIIIPQTVAKGTAFIEIKIGTKTYTYSIPADATADETFKGGNQYSYEITVNTYGITLTSTEITNWINNDKTGSATN